MTRISCLLIAIGLTTACKKSTDDDRAQTPTTVPGPGAADTTTSDRPDTPPSTTTTTPPSTTTPPATTTTTPPPTATPGALTNPQVLAVVATVHQIEIDAANLALEKTKNADVKAFAEMMLDEHGDGLTKLKTHVDRLGAAPEDTAMVNTLKADAAATIERLKGLEGAAFDQAYMDEMVEGHQKVLDTIAKDLMPAATDADVKTYLEEWRPGVAKHLDHAQKASTGMKRPS